MLWFVLVGVFVVKFVDGICVVVIGVFEDGVFCWIDVE